MSGGRVSRIIGDFSVPCLLLGLLFFAASLTPSLIPRGPAVQGVLGGLVTAIGYLIAHVVALIWQAAELPRPYNNLGVPGANVYDLLFTTGDIGNLIAGNQNNVMHDLILRFPQVQDPSTGNLIDATALVQAIALGQQGVDDGRDHRALVAEDAGEEGLSFLEQAA